MDHGTAKAVHERLPRENGGRTSITVGDNGEDRAPTIVLADDDPSIVDLLAELLEDEGYRVLRASDGVQAWILCQRHHPRVVITDVMMPKMNGLELVSRLRGSPRAEPPAVIVMSAVRRPLSRPGVTFLPKPFDLDDMLESVATRLGERTSA